MALETLLVHAFTLVKCQVAIVILLKSIRFTIMKHCIYQLGTLHDNEHCNILLNVIRGTRVMGILL